MVLLLLLVPIRPHLPRVLLVPDQLVQRLYLLGQLVGFDLVLPLQVLNLSMQMLYLKRLVPASQV